MKTCLLHGSSLFEDPYQSVYEPKSKLYKKFRKLILELYQNGYGTFLCDLHPGANLWMANIVLTMKDDYPGMELYCVFPNSRYRSRCQYFDSIASLCDGQWNLRTDDRTGTQILFHEDNPVRADLIVLLYQHQYITGTDFFLWDAAKNASRPRIVLNIPTLDIVYHDLPSVWKIFHTQHRVRHRQYKRYKVTSVR